MELVLKLAFTLLRSNSHYIRRHLSENFGAPSIAIRWLTIPHPFCRLHILRVFLQEHYQRN
jgi:hypothetical protein